MPYLSEPKTSLDVILYLHTNKKLRYGADHYCSDGPHDTIRCIVPGFGSTRRTLNLRGEVLGVDIGEVAYRVLGHDIQRKLDDMTRENRFLRRRMGNLMSILRHRDAEISRLRQNKAN